ncbi:unnamed protein product [Boreogadus saida]
MGQRALDVDSQPMTDHLRLTQALLAVGANGDVEYPDQSNNTDHTSRPQTHAPARHRPSVDDQPPTARQHNQHDKISGPVV